MRALRAASCLLTLALSGAVGTVRAQVRDLAGSVDDPGEPHASAKAPEMGPFVPERLGALPRHEWRVGVLAEYGNTSGSFGRDVDGFRVGVSVGFRKSAWGPHLRVLASPNGEGFVSFSGLAGAGLRAHFDAGGRDLSFGVGGHFELRARDHVWLAYLTPLELGTTLIERGSLRVRLTLGLRKLAYGDLLNVFLLDPNGYDDERSRDALTELREDHPWQSFLCISVSRRL